MRRHIQKLGPCSSRENIWQQPALRGKAKGAESERSRNNVEGRRKTIYKSFIEAAINELPS
jgi:hypothetical protein